MPCACSLTEAPSHLNALVRMPHCRSYDSFSHGPPAAEIAQFIDSMRTVLVHMQITTSVPTKVVHLGVRFPQQVSPLPTQRR